MDVLRLEDESLSDVEVLLTSPKKTPNKSITRPSDSVTDFSSPSDHSPFPVDGPWCRGTGGDRHAVSQWRKEPEGVERVKAKHVGTCELKSPFLHDSGMIAIP